jgi:predicted dehydrogenase
MTRYMICGLGSIGRRHLRNLLSLGETDVVLVRSGRSTLPDQGLEGLPVEQDLAAALDRWRPEAVVVATPTALHLDSALPAAQAGCHILLEKPISHRLDGVEALQAVAAQTGSRVLVGFQFRFHPGLQIVRSKVQAGDLGEPVSVRAHWGEFLPAWHPWEDYQTSYSARADLGGGVVLTLCHPLDYLPWILGHPSRVWAQVGRLSGLDLDVEDTAEIGLRFATGMLGSVHLNYVQRPPMHRLEIVGTEASLVWDGLEGWVRVYTGDDVGWDLTPAPDGFGRNDMFLAEMRHFQEVVRGEMAPVCTLDDGIRALRLALAALESSAEARPVELEDHAS